MSKSLDDNLRLLRLASFKANYEKFAKQAEAESWSFPRFLEELSSAELLARKENRRKKNLKASKLPLEKTFNTLNLNGFSRKTRLQVSDLKSGSFVEKGANVLCFGLPGLGKTHLCCAIGHALVEQGFRVYFTPAFRLVQRLLVAKRDLRLDDELRKLDLFDAVIVDDLGYIQQDQSEMEVLFTFLAERYERRSVLITSNLVFSQWERIFKDPMTTAAAIDRLVHHATIVELKGKSVRTLEAQAKLQESADLNPDGEL